MVFGTRNVKRYLFTLAEEENKNKVKRVILQNENVHI